MLRPEIRRKLSVTNQYLTEKTIKLKWTCSRQRTKMPENNAD